MQQFSILNPIVEDCRRTIEGANAYAQLIIGHDKWSINYKWCCWVRLLHPRSQVMPSCLFKFALTIAYVFYKINKLFLAITQITYSLIRSTAGWNMWLKWFQWWNLVLDSYYTVYYTFGLLSIRCIVIVGLVSKIDIVSHATRIKHLNSLSFCILTAWY